MIDTHTHLYDKAFEDGGVEAVRRGLESGVTHFILPNTDLCTIEPIKKLHSLFPKETSMAMGLHPTDIGEHPRESLEEMFRELDTGKYVAVGEVGIDLYWDKSNLKGQQEVFALQLDKANDLSLPVIIHSRDAFRETLDVIKDVNPEVILIFHSFTGGVEEVRMIREVCDPYFGINGVVTYKNAGNLREALLEIGSDRLLLETDSPYLSPVPFRGKRNESSYLHYIRDAIASSMGVPPEQVEDFTVKNSRYIFKL